MTLTVPTLPAHCNSWIVADGGSAVMETWDRTFVERLAANAKPGVEIFTAADWLAQLNTRKEA